MKSFLEYLFESKNTDTSILQTILKDNTYQFEIVPVTSNGKASKSRFKALVDKEYSSHSSRANIMKYLADKYDGTLVGNNEDPDAVKFDNYGITVFVKPKSKQGTASDGVDSEYFIVEKINTVIKNANGIPITFVFNSISSKGTKRLVCSDIIKAEQCGKDASNRTKKIKADIRLKSKNKSFNISLKKKGAVWIENGSVYGNEWYVPTIKNAISTNKTKLSGDDLTGYKLSKTIYWKMTDDEKEAGLFGDDILPNGAVVEATFTNDTELKQIDENTFEIPVLYIITKLNDAKDSHDLAWFAVNHHGRPGHWRGIYVRAAFMSRANSNTVEVDRIDKK